MGDLTGIYNAVLMSVLQYGYLTGIYKVVLMSVLQYGATASCS